MAAGGDTVVTCSVVGRDLARDGAGLGEALEGLRSTARQVTGRDPDFPGTSALCTAWAEETLSYLHQISCEDPLTGLATLPHLRARLAEVYRGAEEEQLAVATEYALVNLDLPGLRLVDDRFGRALALVRFAETIRLVFPGRETVCRVGHQRLVVLARRTPGLGVRVANVRGLVAGAGETAVGARVWIEGLPQTNDSAASLLDELARGG